MDSDYATPGALTALFAIYLGFIGFILLFGVAYYVVTSIAFSRFFTKVGVDGWIAWVPFYSTWKRLEIGGQPGWLSLLRVVSGANIVTSVFLFIGMYRTGIAFRKEAGFLVLGIFIPFVWAFLLASDKEQYHPEFIAQAGYPPPLAGIGSVAHFQQHPEQYAR